MARKHKTFTGRLTGGQFMPGGGAKIGRDEGIRNPGAVLAAATRRASPAAKKANPALKRVRGK